MGAAEYSFRLFTLDFTNPQSGLCLFPRSPIGALFSSLAIWPLVLAQLLVTWLCALLIRKLLRKRLDAHPRLEVLLSNSAFVRTAVMLLLFSFVVVLDTCVEGVWWKHIEDGYTDKTFNYLRAYPGVSIESDEYIRVRWFFWLLLVLTATTPLLLYIALRWARRKGLLDHPHFVARYGGLYETYKGACYWYEPLYLMRRALFVIVNALGAIKDDQWPGFRGGALFLCAVLYLIIHVLTTPFSTKVSNVLEGVSLFALCALGGLHAVIDGTSALAKPNSPLPILYVVILFACGLVLLLYVVYEEARSYGKMITKALAKRRVSFLLHTSDVAWKVVHLDSAVQGSSRRRRRTEAKEVSQDFEQPLIIQDDKK